ncbi:parathyroid hormone 4 [Takifugu rubripes]|uniref:Parathyroid hormone-like protein n=1 Tax=Takifugu rubripes TaxID=31033 RepID=Q2PCS5_TAKRU|nr:parathyroid hormone 4-like [Takifugu rubripes]XP_029682097.1 parathyroid hormone 4-like [Takifugu rubripes]XP_029682098.1 parathyroid hormone 4-like [Takifugu rubripes]CAG26462.1 parathyroid hormone-like protein [Takifugu rubripes]
MQAYHGCAQRLAIVLLVLTSCRGQEDESRRSVTEHQLMHDRGRNIQSLKRLFWLSSAIEGLHTAQSRSAALNPVKVPNLAMNPSLGSAQPAVKSLLRGFFNPYLTQLPEPEA